MTVRRLVTLLSACTIATTTAVVAQPKGKKAPPPVAPAKDAPAVPAPGSGSAEAPPPEEEPPKDIEGRDENPTNPGGLTVETDNPAVVVPTKKKTAGYPIEEYARPINLPANMSEVAIGPHARLGAGDDTRYAGGDALRARYGITREVQLGLTYLFAGIYDDPATVDTALRFRGGKAVGLDVTVLVKNWMGIRVGVPFYIKPVAASLAIGVPLKFQIGDKYAIGGLDDLLNIRLKRFAPTFYQEVDNATNANDDTTNSILSRGQFRVSAFGVYQYKPKVAFIGRTGFNMEDFTATRTQSDAPNGGLTYFIRAQINWSPRPFVDLGASLGFDDLAHVGTFGPAGFLAFRI